MDRPFRAPSLRSLMLLCAVVPLLLVSSSGTAADDLPNLTLTAAGSEDSRVSGPEVVVSGDAASTVEVTALDGGAVTLVAGPAPELADALRFPPYVVSGTYPRAVVRVTPASGLALSPGSADFEFGAVVRLDQTSYGRSVDNGDNVFQRGLTTNPGQFKLELDGGRPACTVKGSAGRQVVRATDPIARGAWHTITCSRVGDRVSVTVRPYGSNRSATQRSPSGPIGAVSFPSTRPASLGGKLGDDGLVQSNATDQLNGEIAKAWIRRLG